MRYHRKRPFERVLTFRIKRWVSTAARFIHARALLLCDAGESGESGDPQKVANVATSLGGSQRTIEHLKTVFCGGGSRDGFGAQLPKANRAL